MVLNVWTCFITFHPALSRIEQSGKCIISALNHLHSCFDSDRVYNRILEICLFIANPKYL